MSTRTLGAPVNGDKVFRGLKAGGIGLVASVPCVKFGPLLDMIIADPAITHVPVTREEEAIGICAGAFMGGKRPALLMQNSGLGNCINALVSLDVLYDIPLLLIMPTEVRRARNIQPRCLWARRPCPCWTPSA